MRRCWWDRRLIERVTGSVGDEERLGIGARVDSTGEEVGGGTGKLIRYSFGNLFATDQQLR